MDKLKPCPFCGGEAGVKKCLGEYWVECSKCKNQTQIYADFFEAVKAWNNRPVEDALVSALESMIKKRLFLFFEENLSLDEIYESDIVIKKAQAAIKLAKGE